MRFLSTLVLIFFLGVSCNQRAEYPPYEPYSKTIKVRELGNQDDQVQKLYQDYTANPTTQKQKDQNLIIDYLTEHKISANKLPSGVYYEIYKYGVGGNYYYGRKFSARYTGYFLDGQVFDSNLSADRPLQMRVGEMIQGWNDALPNVTSGCKVSLFIPSHMAYGETGVKGVVPPNAVLIFDIEMVK